jgi:hypothetical protein
MSGKIKTPAQISTYVDILGVEGTLDFLLEFGGAELYIAANPKRRSRLVKSVGFENAMALAKVSNKLQARVPTSKPWIATVLKSKGLSVAEIARKLHSSDVAVRGWLKSAGVSQKVDTDQPLLPLFRSQG